MAPPWRRYDGHTIYLGIQLAPVTPNSVESFVGLLIIHSPNIVISAVSNLYATRYAGEELSIRRCLEKCNLYCGNDNYQNI